MSLTDIIIGLFMFIVILFFYLHIQFHYKTSNDLEIYEIENASKDKVEEICDLRQPVLIDFPDDDTKYKILNNLNKQKLLDNYPIFEIKINSTKNASDNDNNCVYLPLHVASKLFNDDKQSVYFSEGNTDFLSETGAVKHMSYNDSFLRPYLVSNCYYDVIFGSHNFTTQLRYDLNYRNYYMVTEGCLKVKLLPPKSAKYLYMENDYENFEFKSPINPWNPQTKYKADFDKVKCLEIDLIPGRILYIPAYWWYSFKFGENTSVSCFKYRTYMNNIAISPQIFLYALQNQNIERKFTNVLEKVKPNIDTNATIEQKDEINEFNADTNVDINADKNI